jgi:uncharacterized protein (DUF1778 family)
MHEKRPGRPPKSGVAFGVRIEIRATDEERDRIDKAASIAGKERSEWIRSTLQLAANQTIEEHDSQPVLKMTKRSVKSKKTGHAGT